MYAQLPSILGAFLHPQPEDAPFRGDWDPLIAGCDSRPNYYLSKDQKPKKIVHYLTVLSHVLAIFFCPSIVRFKARSNSLLNSEFFQSFSRLHDPEINFYPTQVIS